MSISKIKIEKEWIAAGGVELDLEDGPTIFVYKSRLDGKLVVEIETHTERALPAHTGEAAVPDMRIRLNEANLDTNSDLGTDFITDEMLVQEVEALDREAEKQEHNKQFQDPT